MTTAPGPMPKEPTEEVLEPEDFFRKVEEEGITIPPVSETYKETNGII